MTGPVAHIHFKVGAVLKARYNTISMPFLFKESKRQAFWEDVKRSIIDYQLLNSQCKQETYHTGLPFQLALQVPHKQKKTVLDAVDGYHSVPLDEEFQPLTTFIPE